MRSISVLVLCALGAFTLAFGGCSSQGGGAEESSQAAGGSQLQGDRFVGTAVETMDSGGYTYVRLEANGESIWAAAPQSDVHQGDEIAVALNMPMQDFHSDTLDRTFDVVYFVGDLGKSDEAVSGGTANPHAGSKPMDGDMGADHGRSHVDGTEVASGEVAKAGHSIAELWQQRSALAGESVTVRGKVVKFNAGIMGRNWVHLQDGSGDAGAGTHDLTVTTDDTARIGDVVLVKGKLAIDRDFGSGYNYGLIVEEADVTVESASSESR